MDWNPNMSVYQREAWVEQIFNQVRSFIGNYGDKAVSTCTAPCITTLKNSYVRGQVFPYINIPIRYGEKELLGLFEYFGEQLPLSDEYIYCDIVIHSIYYAGKESRLAVLEEKARQIFQARNYDIIQFEQGMATLRIARSQLANGQFLITLKNLLDDAIMMQAEIS